MSGDPVSADYISGARLSVAGPDDVTFEFLDEFVGGAPALRRVVILLPVLAHGADVAGIGKRMRDAEVVHPAHGGGVGEVPDTVDQPLSIPRI